MPSLIVFSHLRWGFVHQRPQQLMTRLARHWRVVFVEEPVRCSGVPRLDHIDGAPNVEVLCPRTPLEPAGFHDAQLPLLEPLLADYLREQAIAERIAWLDTPMALPLLGPLAPRAVIYDCSGQPSAGRGAPRQWRQRENALLKIASLVFASSPALCDARRGTHAQLHCLPNGVDDAGLAPGGLDRGSDHARAAERLHAALPRPRLGCFGPIDERIDLALLAALADARPAWQIVMAGPVAGRVDRAALPQRANLHWLGAQPEARLPYLLPHWNLALLPWSLDATTQAAGATRALEYLAGEKPVVSTALHDVVALLGDVLHIGRDADGFIAACDAALAERGERRRQRQADMRAAVGRLSWEGSAERAHALIAQALERPPAESAAWRELSGLTAQPAAAAAAPRIAVAPRHPRHVVIGAGPTGLAAAWQLGQAAERGDVLLVEREERVGGWCRSVRCDGFTFDHAGHIMFSNEPEVHALYDRLLGDNLHWQNREAWIWSHGVYTRYPFQGALYGLPPAVLKECLLGAIEARLAATTEPPANFEQFIQRVWGAGIARHFAVPYNEKLWAVPLAEMETSWLGGRVPLPDLAQIVEGALEPSPPPMGPNARFGYPLVGGFQALMDGFLPLLDCELALKTSLLHLSPHERRLRLDDGRSLPFDTLISTLPLPQLVAACGDEAPPEVRAAARALRQVSVRCVNLGIALPEGRARLTDKHWIYYPEDTTLFHRIFVQGNASPHNNAPGGFALTCEITYGPAKPLPCDGPALTERVVAECRAVGIFGADDAVLSASQLDLPCAYVVHDHARAANVALIRRWLEPFRIVSAGRYGEWAYYNSDHAFIAGRRAAEQALGLALPQPRLAEAG